MLRFASRTITKFIRNDINKVPNVVTRVVTDAESKRDIYKLRYDVMARGKTVFPLTHYCIRNGDEFRDDYDDDPSTKHFLVRKNGKAVASCRLLDGNKVKFEIEKYKWYHLPTTEKNIVEPTRVVACKSISGSYIAPLMLTHSLLDIYDNKYHSMLGIVNADALPLIKHYQKFMPALKQVSKEKFAVNEFIPGRSCHAFLLKIGSTEKERDMYVLTTLFPCFLLYKSIYFTKR
jgi:hypothetical protein